MVAGPLKFVRSHSGWDWLNSVENWDREQSLWAELVMEGFLEEEAIAFTPDGRYD